MNLCKEIEKHFLIIEKCFSKKGLLEFKNTPKEDLYAYHFELGTWIRNNSLYNENSILYNLFLENGIDHPDDMSSIIIELFHQYISGKI